MLMGLVSNMKLIMVVVNNLTMMIILSKVRIILNMVWIILIMVLIMLVVDQLWW